MSEDPRSTSAHDAAGALPESFDRLWSELERIGRNEGTGGYDRFAWTATDLQLREWFSDQARARGMSVERDRNGNQWAWWGEPGSDAVVTGSHLDSVPGGGAFDGPLGVVSGLLAVDDLRARGVQPRRPLAVVNFADEEGARFGVACIGSQLMTGVLDPARARALRDVDGTSLAEAMSAAGADPESLGQDEERLGRIGVFVELHVEQGRALTDLGAAVGVASAIWPHGRWRCRFTGEGNHAGTTRLVDRHDPMLPFAETVLAARSAAARLGGVATFGKVRVDPGGTNVIAAAVDAWLDSRAAEEATLRDIVAAVAEQAEVAAGRHGVGFALAEESWSPVVAFGEELRKRLAGVLGGAPVLPTGAGHDAGVLAARVPSAMLFVRNPTGVSHSPGEYAEVADCHAGVRALSAVLEDLLTD